MSTAPSAKLLLGPILIGASLDTALFGICIAQFAVYYQSARREEDGRPVWALVLWECIVTAFHSVITVYFLWLYMVDNFLNPLFLQAAPWPISAVPIFTALSACPVQIFMAYRIFRLSKSRFLFAFLALVNAANVAIATATSILGFRLQDFDDGSRLTPIVNSWIAVSVVNDLSLTVWLVFLLYKKRHTGLSKTNGVIKRLIRDTLESAAFATFFSVMVLVMFTVFPSTGLHLMFSQPMGRIYTSTLLSTLNG
ncbi:hypothetical protein K438DRAFT_1925449, partial [Mycena galopus ATCC 62051]